MSGKIPWWVWGLGLAGAGYVVYRLWSGAAGAVTGAAAAVTGAVSSGIANLWLSLPVVGLGGPGITVSGNLQLPDGTLVPLNDLVGKLRQDPNNESNVYTAISGNIYQLSPSNAQGNYPATLIGPAPAGA